MIRNYDNIIPILLSKYCVYCGSESSVLDHYLPWKPYRLPYCLPCCRQCNSYLSDLVFDTLNKRLTRLKKTYFRKYKKLLGWNNLRQISEGTKGFLFKEITDDIVVRKMVINKINNIEYALINLPDILLINLQSKGVEYKILCDFLKKRLDQFEIVGVNEPEIDIGDIPF